MAAIVTGLIPILRTAVDATTTYKGRTAWFGFLCIRLVTLFVAEMPWFKLDSDFSCNITRDGVCMRACFNQFFDKPVVMAWNFLFVLLILSVLIMELFTAHLRAVFQKRTLQERSAMEMESVGEQKSASELATNSAGVVILDMHRSRNAVLFYLLSVMLRIVVEVWFVYVLLYWNLPKLKAPLYICDLSILDCPKQQCVVRAAVEKCMSIYALVSISVLVIAASCLFCLYFIAHYLCNCCSHSSHSV